MHLGSPQYRQLLQNQPNTRKAAKDGPSVQQLLQDIWRRSRPHFRQLRETWMRNMSRLAGNISQRALYADMLLHEKHFEVHSKAQVLEI